jgi:small-conductance mechanosensitive channel
MTASLDFIDRTSTRLTAVLAWMTPNVAALVVLAIAAACALAVHALITRVLRRFLRGRGPYLQSFLAQARSLTRTAFLLLALGLVLPTVPLSPDARAVIGRLLLLAFIGLLGWIAMTAMNVTAVIYLRRFNLDAADNVIARKHVTQVRILQRAVATLVLMLTIGAALMTFDTVRQFGVSLLASAGVAGIVAGLAARPVLSNLIAGVQLAITQPIRLGDSVIVEGEFGDIEEITSTYVVVRVWDLRRLVVPLTYFIEKPFQNWTREGSAILGSVMLYLDYTAPVARIRAKAEEIVRASPLWNGHVCNVQVTDARPDTMELRVLVSANSAGAQGDLRAEVREKLIDFLQREHPLALPRRRNETIASGPSPAEAKPRPAPN